MPLHVLLGVLALLALLLAAATREPGRAAAAARGARFHAWSGIAAGAFLAAHVLMSSSHLPSRGAWPWPPAPWPCRHWPEPRHSSSAGLLRRPAVLGRARGATLLLGLLGIFALLVGIPALVAGLHG